MNENVTLPRTDLSTPSAPDISLPPVKKKANIFVITTIISAILFLTVSIAYAYQLGKKNNPPIVVVPTPTEVPAVDPTITSVPTSADQSEFGTLTYLQTPEKIANPDIINTSVSPEFSGYMYASIGAYRVGKFSSGAELLTIPINPEGPSIPYYYRVIRQSGKYYLIESLINDNYIKNDLSKVFKKDLVKIISLPLKELLPPEYIVSEGKDFVLIPSSFGSSQFITELKTKVKIASSSYGDFIGDYQAVPDLSDTYQRIIYLQLKDSTLLTYRLSGSLSFTDNKVPNYYLDNGQYNKSQYENAIATQCGGSHFQTVVKNGSPLVANLTPIGKTSISSPSDVFQIRDESNKLLNFLYKQYSNTIFSGGPSPIASSLSQFNSMDNHIIYQDKIGDFEVFVNSKFALQAECGKPVVYLYPTSDTPVSVKVGAKVTLSEPLYPAEGWNVIAHPNGQLDYQGKTYSNLFWEGIGLGVYPNKSNYGVIVPQSKLTSTLKLQLTQLGLNTQESADFMEFWADKLPVSPYVRLTWLDTKDMNTLAPLQISPMPKTSIRIFLEFQGLDNPISLIPQKLTSIPRKGFTLVEWGGLLRK